jgi:hypothetical protein
MWPPAAALDAWLPGRRLVGGVFAMVIPFCVARGLGGKFERLRRGGPARTTVVTVAQIGPAQAAGQASFVSAAGLQLCSGFLLPFDPLPPRPKVTAIASQRGRSLNAAQFCVNQRPALKSEPWPPIRF